MVFGTIVGIIKGVIDAATTSKKAAENYSKQEKRINVVQLELCLLNETRPQLMKHFDEDGVGDGSVLAAAFTHTDTLLTEASKVL
jgi:uncharacterized membrane-anchored protein YhcB (DUF1043 family)